jgi:hypothetical protein
MFCFVIAMEAFHPLIYPEGFRCNGPLVATISTPGLWTGSKAWKPKGINEEDSEGLDDILGALLPLAKATRPELQAPYPIMLTYKCGESHYWPAFK